MHEEIEIKQELLEWSEGAPSTQPGGSQDEAPSTRPGDSQDEAPSTQPDGSQHETPSTQPGDPDQEQPPTQRAIGNLHRRMISIIKREAAAGHPIGPLLEMYIQHGVAMEMQRALYRSIVSDLSKIMSTSDDLHARVDCSLTILGNDIEDHVDQRTYYEHLLRSGRDPNRLDPARGLT